MVKVEEVNLINLNAYTVKLDGVDNVTIASQMYEHAGFIEPESPEYGWQSRGFVQYEDLVVPITKKITELENKIKESIFQISQKECVIDDIWGVILTKDQSVIAHNHSSNLHPHPQEYFSFAYYPDAPEGSAELIFSVGYCDKMSHVVPVYPETGLLVIFNSYINHMTARHKLDTRRLVISGNTSPVNPSVQPNADWSVYHTRPNLEID